MARMMKALERVIIISLIAMMSLVIIFATGELAWIIFVDLTTPPILVLEIDQLLEIFGFFLLILIGIELLETIRAYVLERVVHVEIVLEVALIAIARKVIILDAKDYPGVTLLAVAALIASLAIACHLERKARGHVQTTSDDPGSWRESPPSSTEEGGHPS
jgi:uncharacterized membrane protein (DUF373 family)